jgi:2-polyprenyl-3-methyl-5-hydroxy-6-metoxy-1,4-benzoquinol methylase
MKLLRENQQLIAEIETRYGMRNQFISAYLRRFDNPRSLPNRNPIRGLNDLLNLPAPFPMWFDYAMSTNQRGMTMSKFLKPHLAPRAARYLDVGCGFGGFLVAFSRLGMKVTGFEIDPERVMLASANCSDFGLDGSVVEGDITDDTFTGSLDKFDAITMIDVIEHVLDVPKALRNAVRLLNPGGVLLLEIPNRHSMEFVGSDGHFGLFGITLLDRWQAVEYHRHFYKFAYDVGDYFELSNYENQLTALGCDVEILSSPFYTPRTVEAVPALLESLLVRRDDYLKERKDRIPGELNAEIQYRFSEYLTRLSSDLRHLNGDGTGFQRRYLTDFWTVLARKKAD